jgi:hypothetical protein
MTFLLAGVLGFALGCVMPQVFARLSGLPMRERLPITGALLVLLGVMCIELVTGDAAVGFLVGAALAPPITWLGKHGLVR